ncbi:VWA domain-containing protein [Candidatus Woesearchaeota archaeon]|nr:VWA domain-containing protein [Candidatus Woesearchaeota archaeon]
MIQKIHAERTILLAFLLALIFLASCTVTVPSSEGNKTVKPETSKLDDWKYIPEQSGYGGSFGGGTLYKSSMPSPTPMMAESIGFSTGGAKDINNFRENIKNNFLPLSTDITYEGLFYDYYFDTGKKEECTKLFCPSYSYAISKDPFSKEDQYYLSVGLNSNIKESDFKRKKLNLVVVLDISGSMSSSFDRYYYDKFRNQEQSAKEKEIAEDELKSKMEVATKSLTALLDHLKPDDRLGIVLFDNQAYLAKSLSLIEQTDLQKLKNHILEVMPQGGTYMEAGMEMGTELFEKELGSDQSEYENRIIFMTDAMPNIGETSETGLFGIMKKNADNKIYSTFIGIGVDLNTELIETMTKIRGANYYSVHSAKEFKNRLDDEFEFMVTPLVFNLNLNLDAKGYKIEKVYGSPEANEATGEIMKVNTLFPSKTEEGQTRGGLVLLKLKKNSPDTSLKLKVTYEDRLGKEESEEAVIDFPDKQPDYFENTGIQKGILLSRYADLMKNWINDERTAVLKPSVDEKVGIIVPFEENVELGRWERQSVQLHVSDKHKELFNKFNNYFEKEMKELGDDSLSKELELLDILRK